MQKFIRSSALLLATVIMAACTHSSNNVRSSGDTASLGGLQAMASTRATGARNSADTGRIRESAIKETALSLGAQSGLSSRAKYIDEQLTKQARTLDMVFDFNALTLQQHILPPVLLEGQNTLNISGDQTIRISDRTYRITKQAHFITAAPNWRQYLWMDFKQPDYPSVSLLPKTKEERQLWSYYVQKGWKNGVAQANTIFEENVARIKEDFNGMILYRKLLAMNMISAPFVAHTDLGVTGDDKEIHIDDRVLRITALPALNIDSEKWKAAVAKDKDSLEHFQQMEDMLDSAKITISSNTWQPVIAPVN